MASLESSYQKAINGEPSGSGEEDGEEDEDGEDGEDPQEDEDVGSVEHRATADDDMAWVDMFILNTRRTGGRQAGTSVLKMYKAWLAGALRAGVVPDAVVDANHTIHYLKYAATRCLLTKRGKEKETDERLSAVCERSCPFACLILSALPSNHSRVTMLGRIRRRQQDTNPDFVQGRPAINSRCQDYIKSVMVEARRLRIQSTNFDVMKGTILEYELHPEQFMEVTAAIFDMDQGTSIFCTCTSPSDCYNFGPLSFLLPPSPISIASFQRLHNPRSILMYLSVPILRPAHDCYDTLFYYLPYPLTSFE
ncbi:hypothetical protein EDB85DRAFT_587592 [Lactarius pseudohatsudake]|nr:hypothetical protein EDB85DRAFT_587592 [Lactarius pseudohatsudake]